MDSCENISLLYVEDDALTRENVSSVLKRCVSTLYTASDARAGIELFQIHHPDIVVTDITMPGMNGLEMARTIRRIAPEAEIVILTAFNDTEFLLECISIGITRYLPKPVDLEELSGTIRECSAQVRKIKRHKQQEDATLLLSQALSQAPTPFMITGTDGTIEYVNDMFSRMTGYRPEDLIGQTPRILKSGTTPPELYQDLWQTITAGKEWSGELANRKKDGQLYWEEMRIRPLRSADGSVTGFLEACQDITERKQQEENLRYLSTHDTLTGLYNRSFFDTEMKRIAVSRNFPVSIIIGDIDDLKRINDSHGHDEGDRAIRRAGQAILSAVRMGDVVARIGGDEFAVLLPDTDEETARMVVQRICSRIQAETDNRNGDGEAPLGISLGVATAHAVSELLTTHKTADARMYHSKSAKKKLPPPPGRPPGCDEIAGD